MLSLRVRLEDADQESSISGKAVCFGSSYIEAFASNQITMSVRGAPGGKEIWIGEDADPMPADGSAPPRMERYREFPNYEGVKILIHRVDERPVIKIARTAQGGCPVYVAADRGALVASWKFEDAAQARPHPKPNVEACRIYLKHSQCQVRDMIIDGVSMLWPGESVIFSDEGLSFREADTPDIVLPGTLSESARATDEFLRLIAEAMGINLAKSIQPLIELSGGLDSSCVAVAACSARKGMNSYAVIHEGAVGAQQRGRRRELVDLLDLNDFEAPSFEHPPFASLQIEECTFTPFDDMYRIPCVYAVDAHPTQDIDLVITGIGGDELTMENTFFRQEWEVSGSISTSAVVSAVGRADMFMRRGIWPVHPLVNQSVVDFCRALPKKMRDGRLLNLLMLARSGLSDGFLFPRYSEHYGNVIKHEAALFDFDSALAESVVADFGIAEFSPLLERAREATSGGFTYELITELYLLLKLETVLRRYVG